MNLKDVVYLHPTKTGGSSIRRAYRLPVYGRKHSPIEELEAMENITLEELVSKGKKLLLTVRHPYSRAISMYNHFGKGRYATIEDYIHSFEKKFKAREERNRRINLVMPQSEYYHKDCFVIKYENYDEDRREFFKDFEAADYETLKNVNPSRKAFDGELSQELKDIIYKYYKKDFELFNYDR